MTNRMDSAAALTPRRRKSQLDWQQILLHLFNFALLAGGLYLLLLPALVLLILFAYKPMYGVVIAFKNYKFKLGILGSPWCGLENFQRLFSSYWFPIILKNTLTISILSLVMGFPMPILLALMVNEVEHEKIKRTFQTISYAPHFISTIVVCGMVILFTNPNSGIINKALGLFGLEPVAFMQSAPAFKWVYVLSGIWQSTGWSSIIYFAALSGVDKSLLEAAEIDGAGAVLKFLHVGWPLLKPTTIYVLTISIYAGLSMFTESLMVFGTNNSPKNYGLTIVGYLYRYGFEKVDKFGFASAVGLVLLAGAMIITVAQLYLTGTIGRRKEA